MFRCINHKVFTCAYGCSLMITWMLVFVMGCVLAGVSYSSPDTIDDFCMADTGSAFADSTASKVQKLDSRLNDFIDEYMCS